MTYATFIDKMRRELGDTKRRVHVDWTGDGATTAFQMPDGNYPVLESSYTVKVNGVTQTETTHYTIDVQTGLLTFVTAPTDTHAVTIDCFSVRLTDADWLTIVNDVIRSLGDDFFKEFVDTSSLTTTANMLSLSLVSGIPLCIAVYSLFTRSSTSEDWSPAENFCNWKYDRENNVIYFSARSAFPNTGEYIKIRGLKTYTLGDETSDTLDLQDRYLTILELGCSARYWMWRYKEVVEMVSKMSLEATRTPLQELIMLVDRFKRDFELEKARLKPAKPAFFIPQYQERFGRP